MKSHPEEQSISISAVERESGRSRDNLRIRERRYGFPPPHWLREQAAVTMLEHRPRPAQAVTASGR